MWTTKVTSDPRVPNSINCNTTGYRFFKEMYEKSNKNMLDDSHLPIFLFIKCGTGPYIIRSFHLHVEGAIVFACFFYFVAISWF